MTILFYPDRVLPHDPAGWGRYLMGHFLEHEQMRGIALTVTPPANIPAYQIQQWADSPAAVASWLVSHFTIHQALRAQSGVTGIDLSIVDFSDDEDFLLWQDDHGDEHSILRQFYGIA